MASSPKAAAEYWVDFVLRVQKEDSSEFSAVVLYSGCCISIYWEDADFTGLRGNFSNSSLQTPQVLLMCS